MRQAYPWMTAVLFLGCLFLGYLVLQQKTEILQLNLHRSDADRSVREETTLLQQRLVAAHAAQERLAKQAAEAKAVAGTAAQPATSSEANRQVLTLHVSELIKEHPEFAAIWAAQQRRNVLSQYGPILAGMHLPPEQLAKLKDLLLERTLSEEDAQQAARVAGLTENSPAWRDAIKQASDPVDQEMAAVVGTDGLQFARQLQYQSSAQSQIKYQYGFDFDDAGVSLSPDQSAGLAQSIAGANYSLNVADRPAHYNDVDPDTMLTPHDNRILAAAASSLNPAQQEILKTDLIQVHQRAAIMKQYSGTNGGSVNIVP